MVCGHPIVRVRPFLYEALAPCCGRVADVIQAFQTQHVKIERMGWMQNHFSGGCNHQDAIEYISYIEDKEGMGGDLITLEHQSLDGLWSLCFLLPIGPAVQNAH